MAEEQEKPLKTILFNDFNDSRDENGNPVNHYDEQNDYKPEDVQTLLDKDLEEAKRTVESNKLRIEELFAELIPEDNEDGTPGEKPSPERRAEIVRQISELKRENLALMQAVEGQKNLFDKNPQLYTRLYGIKSHIGAKDKENGEAPKAQIADDGKGNPFLAVSLMQPSPFSFAVRDGKITFTNYDVTSEQLKEMLSFMEMNGIKNIVLPDGLDVRLKANLEKAMAERENPSRSQEDIQRQMQQLQENPGSISNEALGFQPDGPAIPGLNPPYPPATTTDMPERPEDPKFSYDYKELQHKVEFDILQRNMGKVKNSSFFHVKEGGWDKWYVYDNQNPDNYDNDGKRDKEGNVKVKNQFVIWSKENPDGTISLGYSMPNGKEVSKALADKLITLHKDRGNTHINFAGMTDDDAGIFRVRCARLGVIPVGIGINEKHAAEMVGEAAKKLSDADLQIFKLRLAKQMRANIKKDGKDFEKDRAAGYIKELEGDYNFSPFKTAYDDVFKGIIEKEKRSGKAENAIGAVNTMDKIYEAYRGGLERDDPSSTTMGDILNPENNLFTEEEINAIKAKFAENGKAIDEEQSMNMVNKQDLGLIFEAVMPIQQKQAEKDMVEEISQYGSAKEKNDAVKDAVDVANAKMDRIAQDLDQKGVKKMYFSKINRSMKLGGKAQIGHDTQNNNHNQQPGRGGRD